MYIHTRSIAHKVFEIWRSPNRFTKNPDIIKLKSGKLLLIYSDTDAHWSQENQILTLLASDDGGKNWYKHREIDVANFNNGDERLVTPRISKLNDGRLVAICDHDDDTRFHEDQSPGNWLYWSEDDGDSWIQQKENGIRGFEPDRIINLPDGTLGVATHLMRGESQEFAEILWVSEDNGKSWNERSVIAYDKYHRFCEGFIVLLNRSSRIACIMRENHSGGIPSFVVFSNDLGHNWSEPKTLPFAFHRPYARQLSDGRIFVTGRNVNGGLGCYGWAGDIEKEAGSYAVGGPPGKFNAQLTGENLIINNKIEHDTRYTMYPPESNFSEVIFEAEVKVIASRNTDVAFMSISKVGVIVYLAPNEISINRWSYSLKRDSRIRANVDLTNYRLIRLHHKRGWMRVEIDGELVLNRCIFREEEPSIDFHGDSPERRTQFGQISESGTSYWRTITYSITNPNLKNYSWSWKASDGYWPDQYQRERLIQIHGNHPKQKPTPDHGYSSWINLDNEQFFLVDYTNYGDVSSTSHLVGVYIDPMDLSN